MIATSRGLITGGDATTQGGSNIGRIAFYDFNSIPAPSPYDTTITAPIEGRVIPAGQQFTITGTATATSGVRRVSLEVIDRDTNQTLQTTSPFRALDDGQRHARQPERDDDELVADTDHPDQPVDQGAGEDPRGQRRATPRRRSRSSRPSGSTTARRRDRSPVRTPRPSPRRRSRSPGRRRTTRASTRSATPCATPTTGTCRTTAPPRRPTTSSASSPTSSVGRRPRGRSR